MGSLTDDFLFQRRPRPQLTAAAAAAVHAPGRLFLVLLRYLYCNIGMYRTWYLVYQYALFRHVRAVLCTLFLYLGSYTNVNNVHLRICFSACSCYVQVAFVFCIARNGPRIAWQIQRNPGHHSRVQPTQGASSTMLNVFSMCTSRSKLFLQPADSRSA